MTCARFHPGGENVSSALKEEMHQHCFLWGWVRFKCPSFNKMEPKFPTILLPLSISFFKGLSYLNIAATHICHLQGRFSKVLRTAVASGSVGWSIVSCPEGLWVRFTVMYLGCGLDPGSRCVWEATDWCFSLSPSLPSSLSKSNEKNVLRWG